MLFGSLLAGILYRHHQKCSELGRDRWIAKETLWFDNYLSRPLPIERYIFICSCGFAAVFIVFECVRFGTTRVLSRSIKQDEKS